MLGDNKHYKEQLAQEEHLPGDHPIKQVLNLRLAVIHRHHKEEVAQEEHLLASSRPQPCMQSNVRTFNSQAQIASNVCMALSASSQPL